MSGLPLDLFQINEDVNDDIELEEYKDSRHDEHD